MRRKKRREEEGGGGGEGDAGRSLFQTRTQPTGELGKTHTRRAILAQAILAQGRAAGSHRAAYKTRPFLPLRQPGVMVLTRLVACDFPMG